MFTTPRIVGLLAILAVLLVIVGWIYRQGGDEVRQSIERQNNEAGDASDFDRSRFDLCADGMWDYGARKCRGTAKGGRN